MRATASAAHARHYGIKDSKASSDLSERIANDVSARHFTAGERVKSGAGYTARMRCRCRLAPTANGDPTRPSQASAERPVLHAGHCFPLIVTVDSRAARPARPSFKTRTTHTKFCIIRPFFRRSRLFSSAAPSPIFAAFRCPRDAKPATRSTRCNAAWRRTTGSRCAPSASACGKFACAMRVVHSGSFTSRPSPTPSTCFTASGSNRRVQPGPISNWPPGAIAR